MSSETRRRSIHIAGFNHKNPIPNAARIDNILVSGVILGIDPATGVVAPTLAEQCRLMFQHLRAIVIAGGGSLDDVVKMTVWLADRSDRAALNAIWLETFPDPHSRPARHSLAMDMENGALVQCDFMAVLKE